ncbi:MAG: hypothetical protein KDB14_03785, partial [Planctomycetales bacterium]|nr:hypothetical protein [Planctomycetales bacterium]
MDSIAREPELSAELEAMVEEFELVRGERRDVAFEDFLPDREHPQYVRQLVELLRADMEFSWAE